jgi:hypothetical protein
MCPPNRVSSSSRHQSSSRGEKRQPISPCGEKKKYKKKEKERKEEKSVLRFSSLFELEQKERTERQEKGAVMGS